MKIVFIIQDWNDVVYEPQKSRSRTTPEMYERNQQITKPRTSVPRPSCTLENVSRIERDKCDTPAGFPLGRGRGQRCKRPEQPSDKNCRPQGLTDKKNSKQATGFGYAVKELKEFMSKQSNSYKDDQISTEDKRWEPFRNDCADQWLSEIERGERVTSTPAVIHQDRAANTNWRENDYSQVFAGSFLERREANEVIDSRVELSTLNKGYLIESLESSDASKNSSEAREAMYPTRNSSKPQTDEGVDTSSKSPVTSECDEYDAPSHSRNNPSEYIMHSNEAETRIETINEGKTPVCRCQHSIIFVQICL